MRFVQWTLLFLGLWIDAAYADASGPVEFPCTLEPGQVYELAFHRTQSKGGDEASVSSTSMENTARFEVVAQNEQGFVLAWSAQWNELEGMLDKLPGQDKEWIAEVVDRVGDHRLMIQTDEFGTPLGLLNQQETANLFNEVLQTMIGALEVTDDERTAIQTMLEGMMSPEFIAGRSMQDANLYFMFTGGSYEPGVDYTVDDYLPSPLGGDPIPCQITFRVESVDASEGIAHIAYSQVTDAEAAKKVIAEFLERAPDGKDAVAELGDAEMGIFTVAAFVMDLASGMPRELWFERRIEMGPARRSDRIEIRTAVEE